MMIGSFVASIIGPITPPEGVIKYGDSPGGLFLFLNNIMKLLIYGAGLFTLFNIILAGYGFISANGDQKAIETAWSKIWQSLLGLVIAAGSFVLAGVIGWIVFGNPQAIIQPKIYAP